jgi:hypothetical protein
MAENRTDAGAPAEDMTAFVEMALEAIRCEYPYHVSIVATRDQDVAPPRVLTPVFCGSFDWHSAVHGHWCLLRATRICPDAPWVARARAALAFSLTRQKLEAEAAFLRAPGREGFERPYGLAWLLQLAAELRGAADTAAEHWIPLFAPLEQLAAMRLMAWLDKLAWPVRSGEHAQSAFALGLFFDWARDAGNAGLCGRIAERAVRLYGADRDAPVRYEPSAQDFLSPILGEADLLRRAMPPESYAPWLSRFLPAPGSPDLVRWLTPVTSPDQADGKFAHLDGLNLSRAWMLEGIARGISAVHPLALPLAQAARRHREAGLAGARSGHYAGTHWLGSFAIYLLTGRGLG